MKESTRKVVTRAPSKTVRILNLKGLLPQPVEAESSLEADYVRRAALCPTTANVIHQPFVLPVSPRGYTPDFLQTFFPFEQKTVVEVKLHKKVIEYSDLFDRAADFLASRGYVYFVLTERSLRKNKINERVLLILRYAKAVYSLADCMRVSDILANYPRGLPMGTLIRKAKVNREVVFHLLAKKQITTGPNLRVDSSAVTQLSQLVEPLSFDRWFGISPWGSPF